MEYFSVALVIFNSNALQLNPVKAQLQPLAYSMLGSVWDNNNNNTMNY